MTEVFAPGSPAAQMIAAKQALLRYKQPPGQHLTDTWADLLQMAIRFLDIPRAGVWFISPAGHLTSQVLVSPTERHLAPYIIPMRPDDPYLQHLQTGEANVTPDADQVAISAELRRYLSESGVRALLDMPMFHNGELAAVICLEDFKPRDWRLHDVSLALALAAMCMQAWDFQRLEAANHQLAIQQEELAAINEELQSQVDVMSHTRDQLGLQRRYLQSVLDSIPHSIVAFDHDLRLTFFNDFYRQTVLRGTGYQLKPGSRMEDFLPPQYVAEYTAFCRRALAGERVQNETEYNYGGFQRFYLVTYSPIAGSDDQVAGGLVVTQDITDRRLQEQEILTMNEELGSQQEELQAQLEVLGRTRDQLSLQQGYLQTLLDSLPNSVVACDSELHIAFCNERFRYVIQSREGKEARVGEPVLDFINPSEHEKVTDALQRSLLGERVEYEFTYRFADGLVREYVVHYTPLRGLGAEPVGSLAVTWDITDRKLQEQELAQMNEELSAQQDALQQTVHHLAEQNAALEAARNELNLTMDRLVRAQDLLVQNEKMASLGELSAGIAHEINNPLNFIHNGMLALQEWLDPVLTLLASNEPLSPERQAQVERVRTRLPELLQNMRVGTDRVIEIVRGLNAFARLDQNETGVVDLNRILDETLLLLQGRLKGIELVREVPPGMTLICNGGQFKQVMMNLLVNAIEAIEMREPKVKGRIQIEGRIRENHILLSVQDNGAGIAPEARNRLFDPFFTTKPTGKGTGLGLAITYGIITSHGGTIHVDSELNQGATFRLELPITQLEPASTGPRLMHML